MRQTYRQDEAEQILVEAIRRSAKQEAEDAVNPQVTRETLLEMAKELGVSEETLASVVRDRQSEARPGQLRGAAGMSNARRDFLRHRRVEFFAHLTAYGVFSGLLVAAWSQMWPSEDFWPKWAVMAWGLIVCWHGIALLQIRGNEFEKELALWQVRRHRKRSKPPKKKKGRAN